jgi:hypothetical protein
MAGTSIAVALVGRSYGLLYRVYSDAKQTKSDASLLLMLFCERR